MHGQPVQRDAGQGGCPQGDGADAAEIDAELVLRLAGRDLGVGARIDIGVDAQRDRRARAHRHGDFAQRLELGLRLDVDLMDAGGQREFHLVARLADAGEDDARRRDAGGEGAAQFALRDDVGAGAEQRQGADHREVRIGLDGVADRRALIGKGVGEAPILRFERGARIAIERRADGGGDARQGDAIAMQLAAAIGEAGATHSDRPADKCRADLSAPSGPPSWRNRRARGRG